MLMSCFSLYLYLSSETSTQQCFHMSFVLFGQEELTYVQKMFFYNWPKTVIVIPILSLIVPTGLHILFYHADYSLAISSDCTLALMLLRSLVIIVLSALQRTTHTIYCDAHYTHNAHNVLSCTGSLPALRESQQLITSSAALPPSTPKTILEPPHLGQASKYWKFLNIEIF